nr:protein PIMREG [Peromyscus maniculatus bairdii]
MASQWQGMTASMRRRSLLKEEHLEKAVARSAESHLETGPLGSLCRQFQRRLPLRAVSLNLGTGPSWKRLETPEPEQQHPRLYRANRDARVGGHPRLSGQMGLHAHRHQRLRREAALRSPCSSTEPLCSPSESDSDLEPVGAGIQHLQKLSHKLDKAIKAEESGDMTVSLIRE